MNNKTPMRPMGYNWARTNMKKSIYLLAFICCVLFVGCKKTGLDNEDDPKEDLSYLSKTYERYTLDNRVYKTVWTYDGHKNTGYNHYVDGQLTSERKNYLYNGLNGSWDSYSYRDSVINHHEHVECEYLDESFWRVKYQKTQYYFSNPQNNCIYETYREYNGKKWVGYKYYKNGILIREGHDFNYDGLRCSYKTTYHTSSSPNVVREERNYSVVYLDDTYLRPKSTTCTTERFFEDGTSTTSTQLTVNEYDDKKPIGYQTFNNGNLTYVGRDYLYDGLTCYYFVDTYRDGEVISTQMYEVEYLE